MATADMMENRHIPLDYASVYGSVYACARVYACHARLNRDFSTLVGFSTLLKSGRVDTSVDAKTHGKPPLFLVVYSFYSYSKEKKEREKKEGWGRNTRARGISRHIIKGLVDAIAARRVGDATHLA
jgi:hypothetical protein